MNPYQPEDSPAGDAKNGLTEESLDNELLTLQNTLYNSGNPTRKWLHWQRKHWIDKALKRTVPMVSNGQERIATALEIGPGSGIYLPDLCKLAEEVTAADIEESYLVSARALQAHHKNLSCVQTDITRSTLPERHFDLILCSEVIEHVEDSPAMLSGIQRLLTENGRLILTTPQRYSPLELCAKVAFLPGIIDIVRWVYQEPILPTGHINLLTKKSLQNQLKDANLHIIEGHNCGFYLPLVAELGGETGRKMLAWLERTLRDTLFDGLLWTQCYIITAAHQPDVHSESNQ